MSLGLAVIILGVLVLLVYHAGFRRFVMWSAAALIVVVGILMLEKMREDAVQEAMLADDPDAACDIYGGRPAKTPYELKHGIDPCEALKQRDAELRRSRGE